MPRLGHAPTNRGELDGSLTGEPSSRLHGATLQDS
jgi:hypothetical protein